MKLTGYPKVIFRIRFCGENCPTSLHGMLRSVGVPVNTFFHFLKRNYLFEHEIVWEMNCTQNVLFRGELVSGFLRGLISNSVYCSNGGNQSIVWSLSPIYICLRDS